MGRNDSRAGGGDLRKLPADSGQNWSMMTPCGMYMNPTRTGGRAKSAPWPTAWPKESMNGSARESPAPFSQVRRSTGLCLLVAFMLLLMVLRWILFNVRPGGG
jgi:hypothetical protein